MKHLPIFLNISGKTVLVVGGGAAAARKADLALRAGALVRVVADRLSEDFRDIKDHERLSHVRAGLSAAHLEGCALAYGASGDRDLDELLHSLAKQAGILVNVVDVKALCDFIMPSIVDRSPLVIGISTSGDAPIVARMLKARLEATVPAAYGRFVSFLGSFRELVMARITDGRKRRLFWEHAADGTIADLVLSGNRARAETQFKAALDAAAGSDSAAMTGEVYLVGAGPGDPDLLTFRALHLIQRADVVLYDRLIGQPILNLVRRDAERIYVGKLPRDHTLPQEDLSALMVRLARKGNRVLRLKGGDPFIFGRGGEEIETLAAEGIPFQIVPGVTAAAGCAAYAGIPLTHRDYAQTCIFVTGHGKDGQLDLDWKTLIQPRQTVAVYMGLSNLAQLAQAFIDHGAKADTPAAVIDNGTCETQRVVCATLETLHAEVAAAELSGPAMIVIGAVTRLHDKLKWFAPVPGERANAGQLKHHKAVL